MSKNKMTSSSLHAVSPINGVPTNESLRVPLAEVIGKTGGMHEGALDKQTKAAARPAVGDSGAKKAMKKHWKKAVPAILAVGVGAVLLTMRGKRKPSASSRTSPTPSVEKARAVVKKLTSVPKRAVSALKKTQAGLKTSPKKARKASVSKKMGATLNKLAREKKNESRHSTRGRLKTL